MFADLRNCKLIHPFPANVPPYTKKYCDRGHVLAKGRMR